MKKSRIVEILGDMADRDTPESRDVREILKEMNDEIDEEDVEAVFEIITETLTRNIRK